MQVHSMIVLQTLHKEIPELAWQIFRGIHIFFTVIVLMTNCLSLIVIYGLVSKLTCPLKLLSSLAFANMLAAWAAVTTYFPHTSCQEEIHTSLLLTSHNATALTLLTYALTHHIATFKPFRYDSMVSSQKVWITIFIIWILSVVPAHLNFLVTLANHHHDSLFCSQVYSNTRLSLIVSALIYAVTLLVSLACYTRIITFLRPIGALRRQESDGMPRKSTHGIVTGIILVAFYLIVWPPYLVSTFEHSKVHNTDDGYTAAIAMLASIVFILINCACNPIIYGLRMDNVTTGYNRMYHKCRYWFSNGWSKIKKSSDNDDHPTSPLNPIESIC